MAKNATGDSRQTLHTEEAAARLEIHGDIWELDQAELDAVAVFLTEMRRTRDWKHEKWCDPEEHVLTADGDELDETPCVGRIVKVNDRLGGWWHQKESRGTPHFAVDAYGGAWDPSVSDLKTVYDVVSDPRAPADQLIGLCARALGELEHGITCGKP